jgi:hypothetical protein
MDTVPALALYHAGNGDTCYSPEAHRIPRRNSGLALYAHHNWDTYYHQSVEVSPRPATDTVRIPAVAAPYLDIASD